MKISGIYIIKNQINGKVYIGQTIDLNRRKYDHDRTLRLGIHHNIYLQREYNKYGKENFVIETLEECPVESLDEREIYWINFYKSMKNTNGYNMEGGGNEGKIVSEPTRDKKRGENNPMYGKKLSSSHVEALRVKNRANSKILNDHKVADIKHRILEGENRHNLAAEYGITRGAIDKIASCVNWYWVCEELNDQLVTMVDKQRAERDRMIHELSAKGLSRSEISRRVGCDQFTVARVLGVSSKEQAQKRDAAILEDYKNGVPRDEIIKKHKVCESVYAKAISEELHRRRNENIQRAIDLRLSGWMVKDIAAELGCSRLTITKWTKHLIQSC